MLPPRRRETICMLLIETVEAVENIEEICAVEGIDCLILAPFDLSTELGVSGQLDHPKMNEAMKRVEAAVLKANIPLGGAGLTREATQQLVASDAITMVSRQRIALSDRRLS